MSTIRCVEPGLSVETGQPYVVRVNATDELLFPHVDSCLSIAIVLQNGQMLGGHVGMQMPNADDLDPYGNALAITDQLMKMAGSDPIARVILVGDGGTWENDFIGNRNVVQAVLQRIGAQHSLFVDTGAYGGGVDVSLNPRRHMVFVQRCTNNSPLVFQRAYADIQGAQIRRLP